MVNIFVDCDNCGHCNLPFNASNFHSNKYNFLINKSHYSIKYLNNIFSLNKFIFHTNLNSNN